jgi:hypothetical protein
MFYSDDPVMDEMRYIRALDMKLARRPLCHCCHKHIQDETALHYDVGKEDIWLCLDCVEDNTEYIEVD